MPRKRRKHKNRSDKCKTGYVVINPQDTYRPDYISTGRLVIPAEYRYGKKVGA